MHKLGSKQVQVDGSDGWPVTIYAEDWQDEAGRPLRLHGRQPEGFQVDYRDDTGDWRFLGGAHSLRDARQLLTEPRAL